MIVGKATATSAPYITLSKVLTGLGHPVRMVSVSKIGRREWMRVLQFAEAVVLVHYGTVEEYLFDQLALAVTMNVPIVRWWVGTDVLNVITRDDVRASAKRLGRIVSANVAVAAHLVSELATAGIRAELVPSILDPELANPPLATWGDQPLPVLTYLPESRREFYGLALMDAVIAANPDLRFIIVADASHSLAHHPNVESVGWVADMSAMYARAGCVLRITEHDGLPRMLIEGLLRGMYAIYAWPLSGCWQARTVDEVNAALARYRRMTNPNLEGRAAMIELRNSRPDKKMASLIGGARVSVSTRARALALTVRSLV